MLGYNRWQLFKGLAASFCIMGVVSLALIYFIPAPPSKVVMATGVNGSEMRVMGALRDGTEFNSLSLALGKCDREVLSPIC